MKLRGLVMHHASEEELRRIEPEVRQVLAVRARVRQAGSLTSARIATAPRGVGVLVSVTWARWLAVYLACRLLYF